MNVNANLSTTEKLLEFSRIDETKAFAFQQNRAERSARGNNVSESILYVSMLLLGMV